MKRKKQKKKDRTFGFTDSQDYRLTLYQLMSIYDDRTKKQLEIIDKFPENFV